MTVLAVPGALNLRDVGGIPVGSSRVRNDVLFRSGQLSALTDHGAQLLRAQIEQIVDLRDDAEVAAEPSALRDVDVTRLPLFVGSAASFFEEDLDLAAMYRQLVRESGARFVEALRVIAAGRPTLVHCTVGKDRTGLTIALALAAVGADREAIIDDYALTASQLPEDRNRGIVEFLRRNYPDARNLIELSTESPAPVMRELLAEIDAEFGSVRDYLREQGMSRGDLDALERALVV